ncbi:MAG: phage baseplate assembly protein V [Sandaracinaceae bacterium]
MITRIETVAQNDVSPAPFALPPAPPGFLRPASPLGLESIFETVPQRLPYLPPRRRAPRVEGIQTAITRSGPAPHEEGHGDIGVDPIGRVRATMPWDRRPIHPDTGEQPLSPPIRLATPWAGHAWGTTFLPREGMELLVAYLDGDPTQPIGLGCLHGFAHPAPRERPHIALREARNRLDPKEEKLRGDDEKRLHFDPKKKKRPADDTPHLNGIRTAIHPPPKDEAHKAFHELSFDDTPGRERVRLHSSGVLSEKAEHDMRTLVGRDQMNVVQGRQTEKIGKDALLTVEGDRTKVVTGHEDREVLGKQEITVKGTKSLEVHKNLERWVGSKEPSEDEHEIGLSEGAGVRRQLSSKRDRHTKIQGDDTREVGGDVHVRCGETYELGGAPLDMKSTEKSAEGGAGLGVDEETGVTVLDGADGECELVADGRVRVEANTIELAGAKAVRFECGEVSMEMTADEDHEGACGGLLLQRPAHERRRGEVLATTASLEMERPRAAQDVVALGSRLTEGGRFTNRCEPARRRATTPTRRTRRGRSRRAGRPCGQLRDHSGRAPSRAGASRCSARADSKHVHREETAEEKDLLARIAELKKKIEKLEKKAKQAVDDRDAARAEYLDAARARKDVEARIKEDDGIDEDLGAAIDQVTAAEKNLQKARREEHKAEDAYRHAFATGQNTDDEEEALEDAREAREEAESDLEEAEEELEETREEHGGLMDERPPPPGTKRSARSRPRRRSDEVVRTQNELRAAERERSPTPSGRPRTSSSSTTSRRPPSTPPFDDRSTTRRRCGRRRRRRREGDRRGSRTSTRRSRMPRTRTRHRGQGEQRRPRRARTRCGRRRRAQGLGSSTTTTAPSATSPTAFRRSPRTFRRSTRPTSAPAAPLQGLLRQEGRA